jgi:hypothetical protein
MRLPMLFAGNPAAVCPCGPLSRRRDLDGSCHTLRIESEQEENGRSIAEVPAFPGVLAYGTTKADASAKV